MLRIFFGRLRMREFNPRNRGSQPPDSADKPAERGGLLAHTCIVRISKEPSEFINLRPRWRGDIQHLYRSEQVGRKRFSSINQLLIALSETISRIIKGAEESIAADSLSQPSSNASRRSE